MSGICLPEHITGSSHHDDSLGFINRFGAFYLGPGMKTTVHSLHNHKIYVAINGDFDLLLLGNRVYRSCKAVLIAPDVPHRLMSRGIRVGAFYLVPETEEGRKVSAFFAGQKVFALPSHLLAAIMPILRKYLDHGCNAEEANELCHHLFNNLTPLPHDGIKPDARVSHALEYLDSMIGCRVTVGNVAAEVALSYGRLEHLFTEQVGIPISRYLLWARTRAALMLMARNKSLTTVALEAGFSDSAHLSRTFRRMIGISPSTLLRKTNLHCAHSKPD